MKEATEVKVEEKYVRLEKWDNGPNGLPDKSDPSKLAEVWESFGKDDPLKCTFRRDADASN